LPVSFILFLIYVKNIFPEINIMYIRSSNYVNNIVLSYFLKSIKHNYKILKLVAEKLL